MFSFARKKMDAKPVVPTPSDRLPPPTILTEGRVIREDGSSLNVPDIPAGAVEKSKYVPLDFAHDKITEVVTDFTESKRYYENHIAKLKDFYESNAEKAKTHYEAYILEIKGKAKRQLEFIKKSKEDSETKLKAECETSLKEAEELRDNIATLRIESKGNEKALKDQLAEKDEQIRKEKEIASQVYTRMDCTDAIHEIIHKVELIHMEGESAAYQSMAASQAAGQAASLLKFTEESKQREDDLTTQLANANETIAKLTEDFKSRDSEMNTQIAALEESMLALKRDNDAQVAALEDSLTKTTCESVIESCMNKLNLDELKSMSGSSEASLMLQKESLEQELVRLHSEHNGLKSDHEDLKKSKEESDSQMSSLKGQFEDHVLALQTEKAVHEDAQRRAECRYVLQDCISKIEFANNDATAMQRRLSYNDKMNKIGSMGSEIESLRETSQSLEKKIADKEALSAQDLAVLTGQLEAARLELITAKEDIVRAEVEATLANTVAEVVALTPVEKPVPTVSLEEVARYEQQIDELKAASAMRQEEISEWKTKCLATEEELTDLRKNQLTPLSEEVDKLKASVAQHEHEANERVALASAEATKEEAIRVDTEIKTNVNDVVQSMIANIEEQTIREAITAAKAASPEIHDDVVHDENEIRRLAEEDHDPLHAELITLRNDHVHLKEHASELETENKKLKDDIQALEDKVSDSTNDAEAEARRHERKLADMKEIQIKIEQLEKQIEVARESEENDQNALNAATKLKTEKKKEIKKWARQFEKDNKRPPEKSDRDDAKEIFDAYEAATNECEDLKKQMDVTGQKIDRLNDELDTANQRLDLLRVTTAVGGLSREASRTFSKMKSRKQSPRRDAADMPSKEEDLQAIEDLEDEVYELRTELEKVQEDVSKYNAEKAMLESQLDHFIKEKRSDVVGKFEQDIKDLKKENHDMSEQMVTFRTAKMKAEAKAKEMTERAVRAEEELKERDERDKAKLSKADERLKLQETVSKQRTEITLKAKAATQGWDAAAEADGKRERAVEKAYADGFADGNKRRGEDWDALNASIGEKDNAITDLLVAKQAMEREVFQAQLDKDEMQKKVDAAKQEVADAIANFVEQGGDGSASDAELERVREEMEAAHEEVASTMEKYELRENEMKILVQKISVLEQLLVAQSTAMKEHEEKAIEDLKNSEAALKPIDLNTLAGTFRSVAQKGTALMKVNKKDETYLMYLKCSEDALPHLTHFESLHQPIADAIKGAKGAMGNAKKAKAITDMRKAIDHFLAHYKRAAEEAEAEAAAHANDEAASSVRQKTDLETALLAQMGVLEKQLDVASQMRANLNGEQPKEGAGVSDGATGGSGEAGGGGVSSDDNGDLDGSAPNPGATAAVVPEASGSAALLRRARAAEKKVDLLKKQLLQALNGEEVEGPVEGQVVIKTVEVIKEVPMAADDVAADNALDSEGAPAIETLGPPKGKSMKMSATAKAMAAMPKAAAGKGAGKGAVDPAELRKLQRRIKELEGKLAQATESGGGGAGKKELMQEQKANEKKIKNLETQFRKDKMALENRAIKAESDLEAANALMPTITSERDSLRTKVKELAEQVTEIEQLRNLAGRGKELETSIKEKAAEMTKLEALFRKETFLRKKYKNELEDLKGTIRVYARCRPMAQYEKEKGCKQVVDIIDDSSLKVMNSRGEKNFEFDAVFGGDSKQTEVFEEAQMLVESFMDGYNVCIFAYGQTGSGKTFTMTGTPTMPGLTPGSINEMYRLIGERGHCDIKISSYFVELYNDNFVDLYFLLDNKKVRNAPEPPKLDIHMDQKGMIFMKGAVYKECYSAEELYQLFNDANEMRHVGATKMNATSSRSHSIFSIMVESFDRNTKKTTFGKLSLVDLAGSERADKTGAGAERLKEAQSINKSLSALGDVIAALSDNAPFVPYRNNKLTQLMQDSLGGNAKTLMFVNFSPADYNADETITSLSYAARVKKITNQASKNADNNETAKLKDQIRQLQEKVADLTNAAAGSGAEAIEDGAGGGAIANPDVAGVGEGAFNDG